ncbi:MAG: hypothetical protein MI784_14350 [Cytophagales bacterium]|nr:hypothetical protein [Cytophagales bacterium]
MRKDISRSSLFNGAISRAIRTGASQANPVNYLSRLYRNHKNKAAYQSPSSEGIDPDFFLSPSPAFLESPGGTEMFYAVNGLFSKEKKGSDTEQYPKHSSLPHNTKESNPSQSANFQTWDEDSANHGNAIALRPLGLPAESGTAESLISTADWFYQDETYSANQNNSVYDSLLDSVAFDFHSGINPMTEEEIDKMIEEDEIHFSLDGLSF